MPETVFNVLKLIGLALLQMVISLVMILALLVTVFFGSLMWFLMSPFWGVKRFLRWCRGGVV